MCHPLFNLRYKRVVIEAARGGEHRVGGRIMVSDLVLQKELPASLKKSAAAYVSCIAGAALKDEYQADIRE